MPTVNDVIFHCQKQIKKDPPEEKLLHYLSRLDRLRITVKDLAATGVGRTVNQLGRLDNVVGHEARKLVNKWKDMVAEADENSEDSEESQSSSSGDERDDNDDSDHEHHHGSHTSSRNQVNGHGHSSVKSSTPELSHHIDKNKHGSDDEGGMDSDSSDRLCIAADDKGDDDEEEEEEEEDDDEDDPMNDIIKQDASEFLDSEPEGSDEEEVSRPIKKEKFDYESEYSRKDTNVKSQNHNEDHRKRHERSHEHEHDSHSRNRVSSKIKEERLSDDSHDSHSRNRVSSKIKEERLSDDSHDSHSRNKVSSKIKEERLSDDSDEDEMVDLSFTNNNNYKKESRSDSDRHKSNHHHSVKETKESVKESAKDRSSRQDTKEEKRRKEKEKHESEKHRHHKERSHKHSSEDSKSSSKDKHSKEKEHKIKKESRDKSSKSKKSEDSSSQERKELGSSQNSSSSSKSGSKDDKHSSRHKDKSKRDEIKPKSEKSEKSSDKHKSSDSKDRHSKHSEDRHRHDKDKEARKRKGDSSSKQDSTSPDSKRPKLSDEKPKSESKSGSKSLAIIPDEIDSSSGVKFEELLGCLDSSVKKSKSGSSSSKKESKDKSHAKVSSSSSSSKDEKSKSSSKKHKDSEKEKKRHEKHLKSIIPPTLNISPNYKPSPAAALLARPMAMLPPKPLHSHVNLDLGESGNYWEDSRTSAGNGKEHNSEDALASILSSRNQRTKVFSGRQTGGHRGTVPKLYDLCMQVIQDNIQDLGYTGGVPYDILKPALERASSQQLLQIEECNPYLIGETDELWKFHCSREFKDRQRTELESWRELFERCMFEREQKFAIIRSKMLKKGEVAEPVRKAKLAYVEPVGGPRFNRQKAATIKNGMKTLKIKEEKGPRKGVGTSASVGFNNPVDGKGIVVEQAVIINPDSRAAAPSGSRGGWGRSGGGGGGGGGGGDGGAEAAARLKPRRAPLMAKTMKFIKTLQRR